MNNQKNKKKIQSNGSLLDIIPEIFLLLIEGLLDLLLFLLNQMAKKIFSGQFSSKSNHIKQKQLKVKKKSVQSRELGYCVNLKKPILFSQLDMSKHTFIVGPPGWGKTNLMNILMEKDLQQNKPLFFLDPKGTLEEITMFQNLCAYYGKKSYIFSEHSEKFHTFNPLRGRDPSSAASVIMRGFDWSNEYYRDCCESALLESISRLIQKKQIVSLPNVLADLKTHFSGIKDVQGIITKLSSIIYSPFGKLFEDNGEAKTMTEIRHEKACLYVGLSTMGYGNLARAIGRIFISELMNHAYQEGTRVRDSHESINNPISVYIDEAGAILTDDYIDLLSKCRASGVQLCTAQQTLADLDAISPTLSRRCLEESSNIFIQKQAVDQDCLTLASMIGTFLSEKKTKQIDDGYTTSKGSLRETFEYLVHPNVIKDIRVGQAILVQHNPKKIMLINIRDARTSDAFRPTREFEKMSGAIKDQQKNIMTATHRGL
jgi:conjugal transfer pilus assembly protein TraD